MHFLHTGYGYPRVLPGPTILISPMLSQPGPDKNHVYLMHLSHVSTRQVTSEFLQPLRQKMTSLYAI